jgi:ATP-dependent Clp protease ATP-binding subunit ClpC
VLYGWVVFDRFSAGALRAIASAESEARDLGHSQIGTEHLLLGIVADVNTPAGQALAACGATLAGCRSKVAETVPADGESGADGGPVFSNRAKRALERASRMSLRRLDPFVEAEHILLSVLDVEGRAGQILRGVFVDIGQLRESVVDSIERGGAVVATEMPTDVPVSPRCARCGSPLDAVLAHRVMTSQDDADSLEFVVAYCSACGTVLGASPRS